MQETVHPPHQHPVPERGIIRHGPGVERADVVEQQRGKRGRHEGGESQENARPTGYTRKSSRTLGPWGCFGTLSCHVSTLGRDHGCFA